MSPTLDYSLLAAWLTAQVAALSPPITFVVGPELPETEFPDILGFVTPMPGMPPEMEGVVRRPAFQVRLRTLVPYVSQALIQANAIDQALIFGDTAGPLWGTRIMSVENAGGEPVPLLEDGPNQRVSVVCTYIVREILQIGVPTP